jgi:hypothetical protein
MPGTNSMNEVHERGIRVIKVIALAVLLAVAVLVQTPNGPVFLHVLQKLGHPVVFGICSLLILSLRRQRSRLGGGSMYLEYGSAFAITLALGAATEIAQRFTHRDPSIIDVFRDALGGVTALSAQWYVDTRARRPTHGLRVQIGAAVVCILGLAVTFGPFAWCLAAYANRDLRFPVLWQFNSALDLYFLNVQACISASRPQWWKIYTSPASLGVTLPSTDRSPGIALREPYPDWQGRSLLTIDVSNPTPRPLQLIVRVHDRNHNQQHEDRFNRAYVIAAGTRQVIAISLEDIAAAPRSRRMDLQHIAHVGIFRSGGTGDGFLVLHRISLQ